MLGIDEELSPKLYMRGGLLYREMSPAEYEARGGSEREDPYH